MEACIEYLLRFGTLNDQQIELVRDCLGEQVLPKGAYFSEAGQVARKVGFLEQGVVRVCYYTKDGEEVTRYFVDEGHFVVDLTSFSTGVPSNEYVQAVEDCTFSILTKEALEELSNTIVGWDSIIHKVTQKALMDKIANVSPMMAEDAKTRYLNFLTRFPNLANRVPLHYIASYIGITRSSLSRLRRELGS